jgi:hypothetical protein
LSEGVQVGYLGNTLNNGIARGAILERGNDRDELVNFLDNSSANPSVSGTATSQVLWSEGMAEHYQQKWQHPIKA